MKYEILGYFEEIIRVEPDVKCLGTREVEKSARAIGVAGRQDIIFTEPFFVRRGHRENVRVFASKARPIKATTMVQITCGKEIRP